MISCYFYVVFLGCYSLPGVFKPLYSISQCYEQCFNSQQNAFEHFAFKVKKSLFNICC